MSYLDPGTSSFIIQWIIAIVLMVVFWMTAHFKRVVNVFRRTRPVEVAEERQANAGDPGTRAVESDEAR